MDESPGEPDSPHAPDVASPMGRKGADAVTGRAKRRILGKVLHFPDAVASIGRSQRCPGFTSRGRAPWSPGIDISRVSSLTPPGTAVGPRGGDSCIRGQAVGKGRDDPAGGVEGRRVRPPVRDAPRQGDAAHRPQVRRGRYSHAAADVAHPCRKAATWASQRSAPKVLCARGPGIAVRKGRHGGPQSGEKGWPVGDSLLVAAHGSSALCTGSN
jgi:hypothetical protein